MRTMRIPILLLAMSIAGCMQAGPSDRGSDVPPPSILENGYEEAWERYRAKAVATPDGGLRIEGDLYFASEDELRDYFDERMAEESDKAHAFVQLSTGYIPAFEFPANTDIRYCVSNDFGTNKELWQSRVQEAAAAWEAVANVRFRYLSEWDHACTSTQGEVDFAVIRRDGTRGYCAANKLLWSAPELMCPGGLGVLVIDTRQDMTFGGASPNVTQVGALRHELGHMIGFRHEHPWRGVLSSTCSEPPELASADVGGVQLGNEEYDWSSVMHYPFDGTAGSNACGGDRFSDFSISVHDGHSAQVLYGMHPALIAALTPQ